MHSNNFCDIYTFEKYVLHLDKKYEQLYILSGYYNYGNKFLSRLSIFDDEKRGTVKQDKEKVNQILHILMNCNNPKEKYMRLQELNVSEEEKRGIGSMLGMAIGDAMGGRYELKTPRYGKIDLVNMGVGPSGGDKLEPGQWTDDTSMGLCIADSLIMNNGKLSPHDIMHRFIAWWRSGYNNAFRYNINNNLPPRGSVGLGGNISLAIKNYIKHFQLYGKLANPETEAGDKNTSGNGTIMRNAAIPICFHEDINLACEMARKQSLITHQGDEAKECCSLLTHIIVQLLNVKRNIKNKDNNIDDNKDNYYDNIKKNILNNLGTNFDTDIESVKCLANHQQEGNNIDRNWDWTVEQYKYSPTRTKKQRGYVGSYAMDNMAMSLNTIYQTNNFKDAIIRAVNIRGDSDSVASVVGQIAGALYPIETIPGDWIKAIYRWDHGEIALRGYMLARIQKKNYNTNRGLSFIV